MRFFLMLLFFFLIKTGQAQLPAGTYVNAGKKVADTLYLKSDSTFRIGVYTVKPGVDEAVIGTWKMKNGKILLYTTDDTSTPAMKAEIVRQENVKITYVRDHWLRIFLNKEFARNE